MGLFNFSAPDQNDAQEIQLIVNDDSVTVSAQEADGMTIRQVFNRFASNICNTGRINRYVAMGRIVDGNSSVTPGTVYSAAIASESKGALA